MYSNYKHHVTYNGLLRIAPSGIITFISELYERSISDKEIVKRSGTLSEVGVKESQTIASVQIHFERAITRIKKNSKL